MAVHERVWERQPDPRRAAYGAPAVWHPKGTYGLLGAMLGVYILQFATIVTAGGAWHNYLWTIGPAWFLQPWSLVTSTLAHSPADLWHILFNGLVLFFFGPILERIVGTRRFVTLFLLAGALSGVLQVTLEPGAALGASGAIMMVFGTLVVLMPHEKILIWGIIPVPFWAAGVGYVALDLLGTFNPASNVGHFAHLSGMAIGLWFGWDLKQRARRRSVQWVGS